MQPHLRQLLGEDDYSTWISVLTPVSADHTSLTVASDNSIVLDWVRDHLLRDIETVARSRYGTDFKILLSDSPSRSDRQLASATEPEPLEIPEHPLNPSFTFERFVVGSSNQFAAAAAEAVSDRPGQTYNPLFVYGGAGLGKTHILHAIAHRFSNTSNRVFYTTTEQFVNVLINCIRSKRMEEFRQTYREVDVLLLDDIQFISGKERTQEEFFHTFNTLQSTGRQVVFTSDSRPSDIPGLEERLRSRFMQGLIADIQPPDLETRCAILREKARALGWDLDPKVALFISRRFQKNVRELEGSLNRSIVYAQLVNSAKLSLDVVRTALSELLPDERSTSPADIIRFVAQHYGIRVADIKGRSNRRSIALPRQVAMHLIREILALSYPEIGKIFGKHHSTAIYALDNVEKIRRSNPDFDATLTSFKEHFSPPGAL